MQWNLYNPSFSFPFISIIDIVTARFFTGGIKYQAHLRQHDNIVYVEVNVGLSARWQIHQLPTDHSIDPKLRCGEEYVGEALPYSGQSGAHRTPIHGMTAAFFILRSLVVYVDNQTVTCGSIMPFTFPSSAGFIDIKSDVFGRIFVVHWPGECTPADVAVCIHSIFNIWVHSVVTIVVTIYSVGHQCCACNES